MQRLHEHYLEKTGASWHQPEPFLQSVVTAEGARDCAAYLQDKAQRDFPHVLGYRNNLQGWWLRQRLRSGSAWGWKEPRTTLFVPFWLQVFPDALIVEIVRHPLAVAMSIRQRELKFRAKGDQPKAGLDQLDYCLRLALTYVEAGERVQNYTQNYRRVRFEGMQADPHKILADLASFCQLRPTPARLTQAAASIKPEHTRWRDNLSEEIARPLIDRHPLVKKLGYGWA